MTGTRPPEPASLLGRGRTSAAHRARARHRAACVAAGHPDRTPEGRCETCRYWVGSPTPILLVAAIQPETGN